MNRTLIQWTQSEADTMATIDTIEDLIRLLDENPEWVEALRARLLTQELLELPERFSQFVAEMNDFRAGVDRFVEATNRRLDAIEARQDRMENDIKEIRKDVGALQQDVGILKQDVGVLKQDVAVLKQDVAVLKQDVGELKQDVKDGRRDIAVLRGSHARTAARRSATTIARRMGLRRTKTLSEDDLWDMTDSADTSDIHANVLDSFHSADLVMEATDPEGDVCYIATEVSFTVHDIDISRATRNSRLLTRFTGSPAFAAVAGEYAHEGIQDALDSDGVFWHQLKRSDLDVE